MNKEAQNLVKKAAKIAGVTCVAAGAVALMTTGAALKALTTGAKYLKDTVQKIMDDSSETEIIAEVISAEEAAAEEMTVAEAIAVGEAASVEENESQNDRT